MSGFAPVVRNLLACENVVYDPSNPRKTTLVNVIGIIHSLDEPPFPLLYKELCIFAQLTECRGKGTIGIDIIHDETGEAATKKLSWDV